MLLSCLRQAARLSPTCSRSCSRGFTDDVRIVEVGPRDGLQNIATQVPTATKIEMIERLVGTGLRSIEATSFVSPKRVPQMSDAAEVMAGIPKTSSVEYSVLVPNEKGLEGALRAGASEAVLFVAASEAFSSRNINCSIAESLERCRTVRELCQARGLRTRAVISCVVGCPFEGEIAPKRVAEVAESLLAMGCYEVGLGDTIGVGTPRRFARLLDALRATTGGDVWRFAVHCHDTYGQALANVLECLRQGIRVFDASVAGLGGCPFAPGATGNVATEDLVYLLHGEGMETGVDLNKLVDVGHFITNKINVPNHSRAGNALLAKRKASNS